MAVTPDSCTPPCHRVLKAPVDEIPAFQLAIKESTDAIDPNYGKKFDGKFFVGFEGSFGGQHVTPRGLSARLLGKLVCVEGIVSKCGLIHPKVVKSVHYCPDTSQSLERSYRDATSIDGLPTMGLYPQQDDEAAVPCSTQPQRTIPQASPAVLVLAPLAPIVLTHLTPLSLLVVAHLAPARP